MKRLVSLLFFIEKGYQNKIELTALLAPSRKIIGKPANLSASNRLLFRKLWKIQEQKNTVNCEK